MEFHGAVIIVTGAGSGIGRATAEAFLRRGDRVCLVDISTEGERPVWLEDALRAGRAAFEQADVADEGDVQRVSAFVAERWGRVDVLVNNAATMGPMVAIDAISVRAWDRVMAVNLRSAFLFSQFCIPHMHAEASIINVSSIHATSTTANVLPYAASKAALEAFTRGLSIELEPKGIRVNCVAPGAVNTPMLHSNPNVRNGVEQVVGPVGQPDDIAATVLFLASPAAHFINGTVVTVDGGRTAWL